MNSENDDRDLMIRYARAGDIEAFEEILRRWDARVTAFLAKASRDRDTGEDLRQEVFVRVHRYRHTYNPRYSFPTWLFRIAANTLKTWQVHANRKPVFESLEDHPGMRDASDPAPHPRDCAAANEGAEKLRTAISNLEVSERSLLLYRLNLNLSYREISEILEEPESTVKSRIYALISRLRQSLHPDLIT